MIEQQLMNIGGIFLFGILAQWLSWLWRIPVIVLLLTFGFLLGPVFHILDPVKYFPNVMHSFIELGVSIILFEGGMQLKLSEFKEVSQGLKRMLSLGVIVHSSLITLCAHYIADFNWAVSAMLGGLLIVTGPTVILPALREAKLSKKVTNYLKWEGILTDPISAMIPILILEVFYFGKNESNFEFILILTKLIVISGAVSYALKKGLDILLKHNLLPDFLQIPSTLSMIIITYVLCNHLQAGSGLFAVTILGIVIGNSKINFVFDLKQFKESLSVVIISVVFIIIAASIDSKTLTYLKTGHILFVVMVSFVLRLMAIWLVTYRSDMTKKERILVGLYGPRGIVAASVAGVISTYLIKLGVPGAEQVLPTVMLIITTTVIVHSILLRPISRALGLTRTPQEGIVFIGTMPWVIDLAYKLHQLKIPVLVTSASWYKLASARELGLATFYGQIIDDYELSNLDTTTYNYLMSMSENDSFNHLACEKFAKIIGHDNVFHLPRHEEANINPGHDKNQLLFESLMSNYYRGWNFVEEKMETELPLSDYMEKNRESILVLIWRKDIGWEFGHRVDGQNLRPGDIVISYQAMGEEK